MSIDTTQPSKDGTQPAPAAAAAREEGAMADDRGETLYRAWGEVSDRFWVDGGRDNGAGTELVADAIRFRLSEIAAVAGEGDVDSAMTLVGQLDRDTTDAYGETHMYTVQVHEVHGYVAALAGDFPQGISYYLNATRLRVTLQGPGHPDVEQATWRTYGLWRTMPQSPDWHRWGTELLTVVTAIHGEQAPIAGHLRTDLYARMLPAPPV
ncbi:hypothetical protein ABZV67_36175 [Streptomyces sp. NPDC005065]|uniref:hypothetical protein n=1 Tax=Streptomyces sp. NPDC005065 TaxID=3154461 RepID=UPI0033AD7D57